MDLEHLDTRNKMKKLMLSASLSIVKVDAIYFTFTALKSIYRKQNTEAAGLTRCI